ncbi:MAG: hypothetical protein CUN55_08715 [Phototrophicales bacterium]|nr:MAG: hypothetical protein CUN55_08715 [Phototrophicales bacterium]
MIKKRFIFLLVSIFSIIWQGDLRSHAQSSRPDVVMAYVYNNSVHLAGADGLPIEDVGPMFEGQAGKLFWSTDGEILYTVRGNQLFQGYAAGGASVLQPGSYGLTITVDRGGQTLYYLESNNPQPAGDGFVTIPLRESNLSVLSSGPGRLVGYVGRYPSGISALTLTGAALQYARDGGILDSARPKLIATYGPTLFYSCCFPNAGIGAININSGETWLYEGTENVILGAADISSDLSRIIAPNTNNGVTIVDLITGGWRSYNLDLGTIERVAFGPNSRDAYLVVRQPPTNPLQLNPSILTPLDLRSAYITIWQLDLITGNTVRIASLGDFYGASSIAVTEDYIFVVVVESNAKAVEDLNAGRLPGDLSIDDPILRSTYLPNSILYRISFDGQEAISIMSNVWGVTARPHP